MPGALVLFTRDLRVHDQPALAAAARMESPLVPAFVLDTQLLRTSCGSANRLSFLLDSLRDLAGALHARGAPLVVCQGDTVREAIRLAKHHDLDAIHMSADITPYARRRQTLLEDACARERLELITHPSITVVRPGVLTPTGADHYRVFTPFWRVWSERPRPPLSRTPPRLCAPDGLDAGEVPELASLTRESPSAQVQRGGETAGRAQLERWFRAGAEAYAGERDELAAQSTSRLSAYLHFGCVSARSVLESAERRAGAEEFTRQLCWRDFHHQVLAARPDLPSTDYRPRGDRWSRDARALEAWREGLTGYPIVDAGMRQLKAEGYMHNRARLIVGSFLTKTLYIDWRRGAAHFARLLADADVANNVGNWQWVAGTGNDTRPNRVLSPSRQAARFDPDGDYVRRYVPELAGVAGPAVDEPWKLGRARAALSYPERIVDYAAALAEHRARH